MMTSAEHTRAVYDFFERCRRENPELFAEVCNKYPVLSRRHINYIRQQESTVGLLGLQPSNIPNEVAHLYDSLIVNEDD